MTTSRNVKAYPDSKEIVVRISRDRAPRGRVTTMRFWIHPAIYFWRCDILDGGMHHLFRYDPDRYSSAERQAAAELVRVINEKRRDMAMLEVVGIKMAGELFTWRVIIHDYDLDAHLEQKIVVDIA